MKSYAYQSLKRMGISQLHLSKMTNIHHVRLNYILSMKKYPTEEEAKKLCYYFDRTEQELFSSQGV